MAIISVIALATWLSAHQAKQTLCHLLQVWRRAEELLLEGGQTFGLGGVPSHPTWTWIRFSNKGRPRVHRRMCVHMCTHVSGVR